jgi:hypothetical protein
MVRVILIVIICLTTVALKANEKSTELSSTQILSLIQEPELTIEYSDSLRKPTIKFKRGKAILFTVFTGFLGGHRIYLGSHHRTPIIYSLTFGGLGILALIDLVHLIFTKNIAIYQGKSQVIMWKK